MLAYLLLITATVANVVLGGFVLANNARAKLNRIFSAFSFAMAAWSVVTFYEDTNVSYRVLEQLVHFDFSLAALMVALFLAFCFESVHSRRTKLVKAGWIAAAVMIALTFLNQVVRVVVRPDRVDFVKEIGYPIYLIYVLYCLGFGLGLLILRHRITKGREKSQIQFIFLGLSLTAIAIVITNVVLPDIIYTPPEVTRVGIYSTLFLTGFMAYTMIKHRFMNIRLIVARSVAYTLLLVTLAGLYGVAIFSVTTYLFPANHTSTIQNVFYVLIAVLLAFTFQPLKRFFEQQTNRIFFRDHYDSQEVLSQLGKVLVNEFILEDLLSQTLDDLCQLLHIQDGQVYVFSADRIYKVQNYGRLPVKLMTVPRLEELHRNVLVTDELEPGKTQNLLIEYGVRVMMKLRTRKEFVGYLLLGDKLSGDIYTSQDIALLEILVQELAVAISNAKAYEEIAQFNLTLQGKVDDATERLQAANKHLKDLDKAKDEFISMASHQLRTPITGVKGSLSVLLEHDDGKMDRAERHEFLESAYYGAERMISLISDMLSVSRMAAGRFMIEKTPVDLGKLVGEETQLLQRAAAAKKLRLTYVPPPRALPTMQLDEGKTRQVVMNFIDNAIYYTPKGGITVTLVRNGSQAELRVKDSGIGVPAAARSHLFKKFYRADNAKGLRADGTGLGLFLAKRVIEDQGGTVIFDSTEGKGSTFGFAMPLPRKKLPVRHRVN